MFSRVNNTLDVSLSKRKNKIPSSVQPNLHYSPKESVVPFQGTNSIRVNPLGTPPASSPPPTHSVQRSLLPLFLTDDEALTSEWPEPKEDDMDTCLYSQGWNDTHVSDEDDDEDDKENQAPSGYPTFALKSWTETSAIDSLGRPRPETSRKVLGELSLTAFPDYVESLMAWKDAQSRLNDSFLDKDSQKDVLMAPKRTHAKRATSWRMASPFLSTPNESELSALVDMSIDDPMDTWHAPPSPTFGFSSARKRFRRV